MLSQSYYVIMVGYIIGMYIANWLRYRRRQRRYERVLRLVGGPVIVLYVAILIILRPAPPHPSPLLDLSLVFCVIIAVVALFSEIMRLRPKKVPPYLRPLP